MIGCVHNIIYYNYHLSFILEPRYATQNDWKYFPRYLREQGMLKSLSSDNPGRQSGNKTLGETRFDEIQNFPKNFTVTERMIFDSNSCDSNYFPKLEHHNRNQYLHQANTCLTYS